MKKLIATVLALVLASTMLLAAQTKPAVKAVGTTTTTASAPAVSKAKIVKSKKVKKAKKKAVAVKTPSATK
jgi:hypothetical protein